MAKNAKRPTIRRRDPEPPTQDMIDRVMNGAADQEERGGSKFPGMTYEQGVMAGIRWVRGESSDNPMDD